MALTATVFKADLSVVDVDRGYYAEHPLTIARHPSETDERMMVRLLAFGFHAHERLEFGRGLSATDEPDLWRRDLSGALALWIDVGQPDSRRIRKACSQSERVAVYAYGGRSATLWWERTAADASRHGNLSVVCLPPGSTEPLAALAERNMRLQLLVQDGEAWISSGEARIAVRREWWKGEPESGGGRGERGL